MTHGLPVGEHTVLQLGLEGIELGVIDQRDLDTERASSMVRHHKSRGKRRQPEDDAQRDQDDSPQGAATDVRQPSDQEDHGQDGTTNLESSTR